MIDYREELDFRIALVIFLVKSVGINNNGRMLLTIEKLKLLILICLTPKRLDSVSKTLNNKKINYLKNIFYDDASDYLDENELKEQSLLIAYMCELKYLDIVQKDSKFIVIGGAASDFAESICENIPYYLSNNLRLIKSISAKSESLITKALMET